MRGPPSYWGGGGLHGGSLGKSGTAIRYSQSQLSALVAPTPPASVDKSQIQSFPDGEVWRVISAPGGRGLHKGWVLPTSTAPRVAFFQYALSACVP